MWAMDGAGMKAAQILWLRRNTPRPSPSKPPGLLTWMVRAARVGAFVAARCGWDGRESDIERRRIGLDEAGY